MTRQKALVKTQFQGSQGKRGAINQLQLGI